MKSIFTLLKPKSFHTIPETYRNALYLANASLFEYTNWYIHRAYEFCFGNIVSHVRNSQPNLTEEQARFKVHNAICWLEPCNGIIDVNIPVKKTDGSYESIQGFRAVHGLNLYEKPTLGGMRICSDLSKDHVRAFSVLSTYKHASFGIDMAGSHGGLKISGYDYGVEDMESIVVAYGKELAKRNFLGHRVDVLEPDLYCGSREMEWIANEFSKTHPVGMACAVGKTTEMGGIEFYDHAFAVGVMYTLSLFLRNGEIMEKIEWTGGLKGKTFIIQGLGKIGSQLAVMLTNAGALCVGVKEHDSFLYMDEGVPLEELLSYKEENGSILEFNKYAKPATTEQIFTEQCDILVLAATHRSIQCHVAERVKAKVVIEAAYSSLTPSAHRVFLARNRLVLPDIFTGCGASIASYLEYNKNINDCPLQTLINRVFNLSLTGQSVKWSFSDGECLRKMIEYMTNATYENILAQRKIYNLGLDIRTAAYIVAINQIFHRICQRNLL